VLLGTISKKRGTTSTFVFGFPIRLTGFLVLHYWWIWVLNLRYGFRVLLRTLRGLFNDFTHFKYS
jgi:hypothetical protein